MATHITQDDLLEALASAMAPSTGPENGQTVAELAVATGRSEYAVQRALRALKREGRLEVLRILRESLDGRMWPTPAYRLKSAPQPPKTK